MKKTSYIFDERCMWHNPGDYALVIPVEGFIEPSVEITHADSQSTKRRLNNLIHYSGLINKLNQPSIIEVTEEDILEVHSRDYIKSLKNISISGSGASLSAPFNKGGYELAKVSASLSKTAFHSVLNGVSQNAYSLNRPAGHHALSNQAMGFCLLSNISIAIKNAKKTFGIEKVVIIDWDVHHGNGQESIFYEDNSVLTISLHEDSLFPSNSGKVSNRGLESGYGYNINIPMLIGSGEGVYLYTFEKIIEPVVKNFKPELIVVACGFDASAYDPLGHCILSSESYRQMTKIVKNLAKELCKDRLIMCHEGGYSIPYVPFCGHATIEELSEEKTEVKDPFLKTKLDNLAVKRLEYWQKKHIDEISSYFKK